MRILSICSWLKYEEILANYLRILFAYSSGDNPVNKRQLLVQCWSTVYDADPTRRWPSIEPTMAECLCVCWEAISLLCGVFAWRWLTSLSDLVIFSSHLILAHKWLLSQATTRWGSNLAMLRVSRSHVIVWLRVSRGNTRRSPNAGLMLVHRVWRWAITTPPPGVRLVFYFKSGSICGSGFSLDNDLFTIGHPQPVYSPVYSGDCSSPPGNLWNVSSIQHKQAKQEQAQAEQVTFVTLLSFCWLVWV